jgi:hypothetical protein
VLKQKPVVDTNSEVTVPSDPSYVPTQLGKIRACHSFIPRPAMARKS